MLQLLIRPVIISTALCFVPGIRRRSLSFTTAVVGSIIVHRIGNLAKASEVDSIKNISMDQHSIHQKNKNEVKINHQAWQPKRAFNNKKNPKRYVSTALVWPHPELEDAKGISSQMLY